MRFEPSRSIIQNQPVRSNTGRTQPKAWIGSQRSMCSTHSTPQISWALVAATITAMDGNYHLNPSSSPTGRSAQVYSCFATGDPNDYAKLCVPPAGIATRLRTLFGKHAAQRFCLPVESVGTCQVRRGKKFCRLLILRGK